MLSLRKYHVKNGKQIYDAEKAKNLDLCTFLRIDIRYKNNNMA